MLALCLVAGFVWSGWFRGSVTRPAQVSTASSFDAEIAPIFKQRCVPCHFPGGKMYERLPFDRPATIVKLGERLFSRIKDDRERAAIRKFLAAQKNASD